MKRLFVAMPIPESTREALAKAQKELTILGDIAQKTRLVDAQGLHVTVKFLGETPDEQVGPAKEALAKIAASRNPCPVRVRGVGGFPSPTVPRVIFAAIGDGNAGVKKLITEVEKVFEGLGFDREDRPPHPHVTLARQTRPRASDELTEWVADWTDVDFGEAECTLALYESTLSEHGSRYEVLAAFPIGDT